MFAQRYERLGGDKIIYQITVQHPTESRNGKKGAFGGCDCPLRYHEF